MSRVGNLLQPFLHLGHGAVFAIVITITTAARGFTWALGGSITLCRARVNRGLGFG